MGYTLIGPESGTNFGIYMNNRRNVEIRNGTVRGFGSHGILEQSNDGRGHRIINIRAISNLGYGIAIYGNGNLVKNCTAMKNNGAGIFVNSGSLVTGNIACENNSHGIHTGWNCTVKGNTSSKNQTSGMVLSSHSTVIANTVTENQDQGINVGQGSLVLNNTVYHNQSNGIFVHYGSTVIGNNVFNNNVSQDSTDAGIYV